MKPNDIEYRNKGILKMARNGILLQWIFLFLGLLSASSASSIWAWRQATWAVIIGVILTTLILLFGLLLRSAYLVHVIFSLLVIISIYPLLGTGFALPSVGISQILYIVILCSMSCFFSYRSTYKKLSAADNDPERIYRLELRSGLWDLNKPLFRETGKAKGEALAKILIPLGGILGSILGRNNLVPISLTALIVNTTMACIYISVSGMHFAIAAYIKYMEEKCGKKIQL